MKIAVIGGGSTYTPELMEGLALWEQKGGVTDVALYDIDAPRQATVWSFSKRMVRAMGSGLSITEAATFREAIEGATFVLFQIRVGGQQARHEDIVMGVSRGLIGQETTGVGGFAKALRTIPVILDMAREVHRTNPTAWIINFTNPSGIVTEAICRYANARCVGLCNVPKEFQMEIAQHLRVPAEAVRLDWVGLNHLGWCRRVQVNGEDILPVVIKSLEGDYGPKNIPELEYAKGFLDALGMIPSSYVRYFYAPDEMLAKIREKPKTRAQEVMEIEEKLLNYYSNEANSEKPQLLNERGGAWYSRVAVEVMEALGKPDPVELIVNCLNAGAMPGLPDDAAVEVPALVSSMGVKPLQTGPVEESIAGLIRQVKAYERLTIEAALSRSMSKVILALVNNPLVGSAAKAVEIANALVERKII